MKKRKGGADSDCDEWKKSYDGNFCKIAGMYVYICNIWQEEIVKII